jgi:hypothetical protein
VNVNGNNCGAYSGGLNPFDFKAINSTISIK